jgi:hypothetical protein
LCICRLVEVLVASNFDGHTLQKNPDEVLVKCGFVVGARVELLKRITVPFGPKGIRKDVAEGTVAFVKGIAKGLPVISVTAVINKVEFTSDVAVTPTKLKVVGASSLGSGSSSSGDHTARKDGVKDVPEKPVDVIPKHFLIAGDESQVEIVQDWKQHLTCSDEKVQFSYAQSTVGFLLHTVKQALPAFTEDDLTIIKRTNSKSEHFELWTKRAFKANTLVLAPCSTEYKDRYWTQHRAALVGNSQAMHPTKNKNIIIDGRLRSVPSKEGRSFALFWVVERSAEAKDLNLSQSFVGVDLGCKLNLPGNAEVEFCMSAATSPQIPVVYNPRDLKANVRLMVGFDAELKRETDAAMAAAAAAKTGKAGKGDGVAAAEGASVAENGGWKRTKGPMKEPRAMKAMKVVGGGDAAAGGGVAPGKVKKVKGVGKGKGKAFVLGKTALKYRLLSKTKIVGS